MKIINKIKQWLGLGVEPNLEPEYYPEDEHLEQVLSRVWQTGNTVYGTVDDDGVIHLEEVKSKD
jgi:hypothetical protein